MSLSLEEQLLFNYFKIVSVSNYEETKNVYREIIESSGNCDDSLKQLDAVLTSINRVIKKYDLEIAEAVDETTAKRIHCLIATNNNAVAQKSSFYDKQTCELLSKIIQACVTSESGFTSEISCLNISTNAKTNKSTLQDSLQRLIKDKWLVSERGRISLGMRCQLELELSIKKQYPNYVKHCSLCKLFLVQGFTCPECESHLHLHCVKKFYKINSLPASSNTCPICKEVISTINDVEMTGSVDAEDEPPAKRSKSDV